MEKGPKRLDNVIQFPAPDPEKLTPEQKHYWLGEAAMHEMMKEEYLAMAERHDREREYALRMVGMLAVERGLTEY